MHARRSVFAALALLITTSAPALASRYDDLVAAAGKDPARADYTALRMAYVASPQYDPYSLEIRDEIVAMWRALATADCKTALEKSAVILRANFTFLPAHAIRGGCLEKTGDQTGAATERAIGRGLMTSILASGDGRTAKTAYIVVTLDEEQFVLAHLGMTEDRQALLSDGGHSYDEIDGTLRATGRKSGVLFRVDSLLAGETKQLGLSPK